MSNVLKLKTGKVKCYIVFVTKVNFTYNYDRSMRSIMETVGGVKSLLL